MKHICAWKTGSTDWVTGKPSLPDQCKRRKCTGEFADLPPLVEGQIMDCFLDRAEVCSEPPPEPE